MANDESLLYDNAFRRPVSILCGATPPNEADADLGGTNTRKLLEAHDRRERDPGYTLRREAPKRMENYSPR
jgi:hypothetical protein